MLMFNKDISYTCYFESNGGLSSVPPTKKKKKKKFKKSMKKIKVP